MIHGPQIALAKFVLLATQVSMYHKLAAQVTVEFQLKLVALVCSTSYRHKLSAQISSEH